MASYFGYIRVSTQKQGQSGSSLTEQKDAIETYARRSGLTVTAWFEERETAAKRGRRVFAQMLRELRRANAQGVIIHKIDRSARNLRDWVDLNDLIETGVQVHFVHDALDLSSRGGRLSADIQAVVAADFIRNLREETRKGFYGRLKQGIYPLKAPIGYLDTGRGKAKAVDPIKGPLVRLAFQLYGTGEWNFHRLRAELDRLGLRGAAGGSLSLNGLTTLLNNPFYIGLIHIRKTDEVFQGAHTPLIRKALYDRVQRVLRGGKLSGGSKHDFLFRRALRCMICDQSLVGERQKERYVYYRCHKPGHASINETVVDAQIRSLLAPLKLDDRELRDVGDFVADARRSDVDSRDELKESRQLLIAKCETRLATLTDALLDGIVDKELFNKKKNALLAERRGLMDEYETAQKGPTVSDRINQKLELANTASDQYENGFVDEKRDIVSAICSNLAVSGNSLAITLHNPFQQLLELRKSTRCDLHRDTPRTFAKEIFEIFKQSAQNEIDTLAQRKRERSDDDEYLIERLQRPDVPLAA